MASSEETSFTIEDETFVIKGKDFINLLELNCEVCKKLYDIDKRPPKMLHCKHTVCLSCLETQVEKKCGERSIFSFDLKINCPKCHIDLNCTDMKSLPDNSLILKRLCTVSKAKQQCKNKCFKHNFQSLESFCETCTLPVCEDCITLYHDENKGHKIVDLTKAMEENTTHFDELERKCMLNLRQMTTKEDIIKNTETHLYSQEINEVGAIKQKFDDYSKILTKRQEELVNLVKEKINERRSEISLEALQLEESRKQLHAMCDRFRSSRKNNDFRDLFKTMKKLILKKEDLLRLHSSEVAMACHGFEFKTQNQKRFEANLALTGEVRETINFEMLWHMGNGFTDSTPAKETEEITPTLVPLTTTPLQNVSTFSSFGASASISTAPTSVPLTTAPLQNVSTFSLFGASASISTAPTSVPLATAPFQNVSTSPLFKRSARFSFGRNK